MLLRKTIADTGPIITLDIADEFALDFLAELELRLCLSEWMPNKISDISNAVWLCLSCDQQELKLENIKSR